MTKSRPVELVLLVARSLKKDNKVIKSNTKKKEQVKGSHRRKYTAC